MDRLFTVVSAHAEDAPPVTFDSPICSGFVEPEEVLESLFKEQKSCPTYTTGFQGDPNHIWEIVDHAICVAVNQAKTHVESKYIVLYFKPINIPAVVKDCLPHLLEDFLID